MKRTKFQYLVDGIYNKVLRIKHNVTNTKSFNLINILKRERIEKIIDYLFSISYESIAELNCVGYITKEPVTFEERKQGKELKINIGDKWAEDVFDCAWFNISGVIPQDYAAEDIVFLINCGGEGLIYDTKGEAKQSITCYASQFDFRLGLPVKRVVINDNLARNGNVDFWIDAAANDLFGNMKQESRFSEACVAYVNTEIRALAYDLQALISVYDINKADSHTKEIFTLINNNLADYKAINNEKAKSIRNMLAPMLAEKNDDIQFEYYALGHAHLDLAWLWPIRESKRKGARTFVTQMLNINRYPDYIFGASQGQLYQWIKESYPEIYAKIKTLAKGTNWDVQGATWVEMDSNLISGESIIRQFFYGKQFFLREFAQEMKIFFVPDSFGYSACLPQVMKLADVDYFLTQKMSWNNVNKFPYHTFKWQGLDGSEVFSHMLPESTYNSPCRADYLRFGERNYQERKISSKAMMLFGIGDGGAGPGFEHIERMNRFRDLRGIPKVTPKKSLDSFKVLDDKVTNYPTHKGELYLEKHQGTYTTQAKVKMYNRKCEFSLRNYEILTALALDYNIAVPINKDELDDIWKEILLYQFHDILPGSSINRVYEECVARYIFIFDKLETAIELLAKFLFKGNGFLNLNSYSYDTIIKHNNKWLKGNIPALGFARIKDFDEIEEFNAIASENSIENDKVKIIFKDGYIVSLFDKTVSREFVKQGKKMGVFTLYKDKGNCWDIKTNYKKTRKAIKASNFSVGADGATAFANIEYRAESVVVKANISITDNSPLVNYSITIDSKLKEEMLRAEFPSDIQTETCNFNIQFGHIERKTTSDNSIEKAQFEVSGQKFVDLSEEHFGLSLINDCKYGFRCKDGVMDINLLRSPKGGPGHNVDQGKFFVKLALLPHEGKLSFETYKQAYMINNPIKVIENASGVLDNFSLYECGNKNIVLESVKLAESDNSIILRLYNSSGVNQKADINIKDYQISELVGVMENSLGNIQNPIDFRAFELKLIKIIKRPT